MITPRFKLAQTDTTLTITVRAPYSSLRDLEVSAEDTEFLFISRPYYLRLNLPGEIVDNDNTHSKYDADTGEFNFTYEKKEAGQYFQHLDMLLRFLPQKVEVNDGGRKIEVLSSSTVSEVSSEQGKEYGFAMLGGYNFNEVSSEFQEIFSLDPHEVPLDDRKRLRLEAEKRDFSEDHYIADLIDCDEIGEFISIKTPWNDLDKMQIAFTPAELDLLKDFVNADYSLSEEQRMYCFNSLLDIIFCYCYDQRTTYFEGTCESGWTICKLCATFCYFDGFKTPKEAIVTGFRRSLSYPLYRNFELSTKVFDDVKMILKLGEQYLIKCLLDVYTIFQKGDHRYVLNNLFIKSYICYIMQWDRDAWAKVVDVVLAININKNDLGMNLQQFDLVNDNKDVDALTSNLSSLRIKGLDSSDGCLDSDDDDSEDDDSDTESDSSSDISSSSATSSEASTTIKLIN